jgi:hypothetical protein
MIRMLGTKRDRRHTLQILGAGFLASWGSRVVARQVVAQDTPGPDTCAEDADCSDGDLDPCTGGACVDGYCTYFIVDCMPGHACCGNGACCPTGSECVVNADCPALPSPWGPGTRCVSDVCVQVATPI